MSDQHIDRAAINIRGPEELFNKTKELLTNRGLDMKGFVIASLAELADDPDHVISRLAHRWPPPKPRSHPRPIAGVLYAFRPVNGRHWYGQPKTLPDGQFDTSTMNFQPPAPNRFTGQLEVRYGDAQDELLPDYYAFTTVDKKRLRPTVEVHELLFSEE